MKAIQEIADDESREMVTDGDECRHWDPSKATVRKWLS